MAEMRAETTLIDGSTDSAANAQPRVQQLWREQNAAFRARVLAQLRQTRPVDEQGPRTA